MEAELKKLYEQINNPKTKDYFEEVWVSYKNKNYRSTVVMLYTIVICDLIFKLSDLRDIYNDSKAEKILNDLNAEKELNPVSPEWENKLIRKSFEEAKLLEGDLFTHIEALKKYRNLCGHPTLNSLEVLYKPNRELVESLMLNILNGLLTKHPLFTKNVFVPFLIEIERIKNDFLTIDRLQRYLESKFFIHFSIELTEYIFKNLWKLVFKDINQKSVDNREVNYRVLLIIYKKYRDDLSRYVGENPANFSDFKDDDKNILRKYIDFLASYPEVYESLSTHTKDLIERKAKTDTAVYIKCHFISESINVHLQNIDSKIHHEDYDMWVPYNVSYVLSEEDVNFLKFLSEENGFIEEFYDLMISHYYHSDSYSKADTLFDRCIIPYYEFFNKRQLEILFKESLYNKQCSNRRQSGYDYRLLLKKAEELGIEGTDTTYKKLFE